MTEEKKVTEPPKAELPKDADKGPKADPQPTSHAKGNEVAKLREEVASLTAQLAAKTRVKTSAVDPVEGAKAVLDEHGPMKTYRALENGTDHKQGFIPKDTVFSTTQPQGSWMKPISRKEAKAEEEEAEDE